MTKTAQDFEFWTGEDKTVRYTVTDATTGASINLAGYSASWILQDEPDSGSLLKYVTGDGLTVSGCTAAIDLSASDTSGCNLSGTYYTELSACDLQNNIAVLAVGTARIHRRGY